MKQMALKPYMAVGQYLGFAGMFIRKKLSRKQWEMTYHTETQDLMENQKLFAEHWRWCIPEVTSASLLRSSNPKEPCLHTS